MEKLLNKEEQKKLNRILIQHKEKGDWKDKRIYKNLLVKLVKK